MAKGTTQKVGGITIVRRTNKRTPEEEEWDTSQEEASTNAPAETTTITSEEVDSPLDSITAINSPPRRRGRPPGSKNKEKVPQLNDQGLGLSTLSLGVLNSGVVAMFGPECGLQAGEQQVLLPPLARIISRLPAGDAAKAAVFIDPLVLIFGLAVWGRRIILIKQAERARVNQITEAEFLRASGMAQPQQPTEQRTEVAPPRHGDYPTSSTNGFIEKPNETPTGGIPSQILQSFESTDINGQ